VLVASGGYGKNTQNFNLAPNQASVLLKWREEQEAGEPVQLSVDDEELLTLAPKAAYKSMIVSAPSLQVGRKLTVRQGGSVCQREITESILLFPVSPRQAKRSPVEVGRLVASMQGMVARVMNESAMTAFPTQDASTKLGYWLYTPENAGDEELPLIVYLHGGNGKGDDLSLITAADGFPKYLQNGLYHKGTGTPRKTQARAPFAAQTDRGRRKRAEMKNIQKVFGSSSDLHPVFLLFVRGRFRTAQAPDCPVRKQERSFATFYTNRLQNSMRKGAAA